jgi:hypothetical protein
VSSDELAGALLEVARAISLRDEPYDQFSLDCLADDPLH